MYIEHIQLENTLKTSAGGKCRIKNSFKKNAEKCNIKCV